MIRPLLLVSVVALYGCVSGSANSYNKSYVKKDPVSGDVEYTYRVDLDNSDGTVFTMGSIGGRIDIICQGGALKHVLIDPNQPLASGWLHVRFDGRPDYEIQGTNKYPYDYQEMYSKDATKFLNDVLSSSSAIMKVGTHKGYSVMKAHLSNMPREEMRLQCFG